MWHRSDLSCPASSSFLDHMGMCLCEPSFMILDLGGSGSGGHYENDKIWMTLRATYLSQVPSWYFVPCTMSRIYSVGLYAQMEMATESCTNCIN